jgi:hypothetical protein
MGLNPPTSKVAQIAGDRHGGVPPMDGDHATMLDERERHVTP